MKMIILWLLVRITMIEKIEQLRNNPHIKDNINKYNYEREIVGDEIFQNLNMRIAHLISDKVMLLMLDLGIPIGIVEVVDEKGNIIYDEDTEPVGKIKHFYKPINSSKEYFDYFEKHFGVVELRVHPDFLPKEKVNHLSYCLEFANDSKFFDFETMNKLQSEIIDSAPLEYEKTMKIFNKYYTKDVCNIFINNYDVDVDDFFFLSGLDRNKLNIGRDDNIIQDKVKEIAELSFKAKNTKDNKEKEKLENDVKNILTDLKKQAINSFSSESDIKRFLDNIVNFNNYSFNNQCLIWLQKPDSKYVASFNTFSKMGYKINEGETGIKILFPVFLKFIKVNINDSQFDIKPIYLLSEDELKRLKDKKDDSVTFYKEKATHFKVGNVFDASQTTMPLEEINKSLNPMLEDPRADSVADVFIKAIYKDGFKVKYDDIPNGAKGYCDFDNNTIVVKKNLNNLMRLKVIVHEYAHSLAHKHLKDNHKEYTEHREQYESEAESIAYVVSKYLGLDTKDYSMMYLYSWSKDRDFKEIDNSFNTIVNYSKKIIDNYQKMADKELEYNINQESVSI